MQIVLVAACVAAAHGDHVQPRAELGGELIIHIGLEQVVGYQGDAVAWAYVDIAGQAGIARQRRAVAAIAHAVDSLCGLISGVQPGVVGCRAPCACLVTKARLKAIAPCLAEVLEVAELIVVGRGDKQNIVHVFSAKHANVPAHAPRATAEITVDAGLQRFSNHLL